MSFELLTSYERPLLRPLVLPASHPTKEPTTLNSDTQSFQTRLWRVSTHIFDGTGDREDSLAWPPAKFNDNPAGIPSDETYNVPYNAASAKTSKNGFQLYANQEKAKESTKVPPSKLVAKRYVPNDAAKGSGPGITLLTLTGMGVPKEMFEPMIENLLPLLQKRGIKVEEIWAVDMPLSGESAQINPIGYFYANEKDITRDLLLFVTAYLPVRSGRDLPKYLQPRRPTSQARQPVRQNLHVVAHSLGAQAAMLASVHAPSIFSSLTIIDPAMIPAGKINDAMAKLPKDVLCLGLSKQYPDHASVEKELRVNKRTRGWDQRAVQMFAQHGVVPDESGKGLRLAGHPRLEWALYYDKQTPAECYDRLSDISVPFQAIMPARPFAVPPKMFEADVRKIKQKTEVRWVQGTTHQIVYEKMDVCTGFVADWLTEVAGATKAHL
ncbi:hypothetical protein FSARC_11112 [Fusarium sarcochroum]|uniref:AB hydrolase-1 domain-containing protein n=1 Tax=Fusarium sarcochroum TaxID=1208366 RepID=A0A8H4THV5_9HYPO|nr:hypothetical protein FSARC_11112 [Fusarium sarcochroum]